MSWNEYVSCLVSVIELFLCECRWCQERVHEHLLACARSDWSLWSLFAWTALGGRQLQGKEREIEE